MPPMIFNGVLAVDQTTGSDTQEIAVPVEDSEDNK